MVAEFCLRAPERYTTDEITSKAGDLGQLLSNYALHTPSAWGYVDVPSRLRAADVRAVAQIVLSPSFVPPALGGQVGQTPLCTFEPLDDFEYYEIAGA